MALHLQGTIAIQIQHLLKLNLKIASDSASSSNIQIQHLLKLNNKFRYKRSTKCLIQIQHLLKLNRFILFYNQRFNTNSNTTLVKVK